MKKLRRVTAVILAMVMVLSTMTSVFAAPEMNDEKYRNVSLYINTSDNSKCELNGIWCSFDDGQNWKELEKSIFSDEYRAWGDWGRKTFDTNTIFKVEVRLANGEVASKIIEDVADYNNTGKWYYQTCRRNGIWENGLDFNVTFDVKFNVTYNVDGVKETVETVKGKDYTIKSEVPTKDGYTFAGWLYNGKTYEAGHKISEIDGYNIELTAKWNAIEYSASYDANGGKDIPKDKEVYTIGDKVIVSDVVPTKDKAVFKGWSYDGKVYSAGAEVEVGTSDVVFTAVWNPIYRISYVVDNEEVAYKEVEAGTDVSKLLTYEYTSLDESKELSDWALITDANINAIDKDIVVVAATSTKTFTVIYNLNGGEYVKIENVPYGTSLELLDSPAKKSEDFSGWEVQSGNINNVTSDVVISGSTSVKKFAVTYKVDDVVLKTYENVEYDANLPIFEYTAPEGYSFSGWGLMPATVQQNLVFEGTTTINSFTVKFVNDNGEEILTKEYTYDSQAEIPVDPKKDDVKIENGTDAAKWSKYTFAKWVPEGDYTVENLNSVKQDMTFKASYTEKKVQVYYYVLNRGIAQKEEPGSYSSSDYSKGVKGTLKSFEAVNNNDDRVKEIVCDAPEAKDFGIELEDGEYIKWYVVKAVNAGTKNEKWHVDGIIVGQKYNVEVSYIDSETKEPINENTTISVSATDEYNVELPEIEGYELVDKTTTVSGVMPYGDVKATVEYQKTKHVVTYTVNDEVVNEFTVEYGSEVPVSTYEVPEGYDFTGFELVTDVEDATVVKQDMEFAGQTSIKTFTVTYYVDGEVYNDEEIIVEYGSSVELDEEPVYEGKNFSGWTVASGNLDKVTENVIIVGSTEVKTFTITYMVDGEVVDEVTVEYGSEVPEIDFEIPEGYDFSGFELVTEVEDDAEVKQDMVLEGTLTLKQFVVTYYVDGVLVDQITVEYGSEVPVSTYEVPEGYDFSGFELVTEVEDATEVKQDMVFEGTTSEIVVEEEEDLEIDTPFAPGVEEDDNDVDGEEEEDLEIDTPFAPGVEEDNNDVDEEEDIDLDTPFDAGNTKTGDASNYAAYIVVLLISAIGAMVVACNKKRVLNS